MKTHLLLIIPLALTVSARAQTATTVSQTKPQTSASYEKVTQERAAKIVATLGITDTNRANRACDLIARQYQDLSRLHAERDARIEQIKQQSGDKAVSEAAMNTARTNCDVRIAALHAAYLAKLGSELTPEQVDKVKDGMTYGVVPRTYAGYLKMYPAMTEEQRKHVLALFHEAREIAMDAGTSDAKHAVFGKYKGRINNYLSKQGFDAKEGKRNLTASSQPSTNAQTNIK